MGSLVTTRYFELVKKTTLKFHHGLLAPSHSIAIVRPSVPSLKGGAAVLTLKATYPTRLSNHVGTGQKRHLGHFT